jgi:hypothetical protein
MGGISMGFKKRKSMLSILMVITLLLGCLFSVSPVSAEGNLSVSSTETSQISEEMRDKILKSNSFFVGKVTRSYSKDKSKVENIDLSKYIDTENKLLKSVTGELLWNYDNGILRIDTPKAQGASGFLNKEQSINLGDIIIECGNKYATIIAISMDDMPLKNSKRIMIQAMTEDKFYGATTENGKITSIGSPTLNVKNIDAKVTFKNKTQIKRVITLDENGYERSELKSKKAKNGFEVQLAPDALYTVVLDTGHKIDESIYSSTSNQAAYVWWEAERGSNNPNFVESNFPDHSHFDITTEGNWDELSGGNWLTSDGDREEGQEELYAKYSVEVPADGEYDFWVRKFWEHGPFRWRFDDTGDWNYVTNDIVLADNVELRTFICANWVNLGKVNLSQGTHTFELSLTAKEGESNVSGFDSFILTPDAFLPRGKLKPGEKAGTAESGYWAFEPDADPLKEAWMDLRYLNEAMAGQSGFVRRDGENLVLGDGTPVKFWAVNATPDLDKKTMDYMASRLAKYGVNMVRFHSALFEGGDDLTKLDADKLDKLHYMVYAMKNQGIYVNISFYFPLWVEIKPEHGIPGYDTINNKKPFALLQFDTQFQEIYKSWAKGILNSVNPYTGIPLAKDPAVAIIEVQNEDNYFFWTFSRDNIPEVQMNKLETLYGSWLKKKYGSLEAALTTWGEGSGQSKDNLQEGRMMVLDAWNMTAEGAKSGGESKQKRMSDQVQFLTEHQKSFYEDMMDFFRNDIGTQSMISASNWTSADPITLDPLEKYTYTATDIIDRHGYFECDHEGDGASYSVRVDHTYKDTSVMRSPQNSITKVIQVENYPHMITETAWTNPSKYHGESVPMWASYGALQGMDSIHYFSVGTAYWESSPNKFPVMLPSILGQFPAFSLLYRKGYVQESDPVLELTDSLEDLYNFTGSQVYETQALDLFRQMNPALYDFENGELHGFNKVDGNGTAVLSSDTSKAFTGKGSLKVEYNGAVDIGINNPTDIPAGSKLRFRLFVPAGSNINLQPFIFGKDWAWNGTWVDGGGLQKDQWVSVDLEFKNGVPPCTRLGIQIHIADGSKPANGVFWVDSIEIVK